MLPVWDTDMHLRTRILRSKSLRRATIFLDGVHDLDRGVSEARAFCRPADGCAGLRISDGIFQHKRHFSDSGSGGKSARAQVDRENSVIIDGHWEC